VLVAIGDFLTTGLPCSGNSDSWIILTAIGMITSAYWYCHMWLNDFVVADGVLGQLQLLKLNRYEGVDIEAKFTELLTLARREMNPGKPIQHAVLGDYCKFLRLRNRSEEADRLMKEL
jgi:hypothetical protein